MQKQKVLKNKAEVGSISDQLEATKGELECSQERLKLADVKIKSMEDELRAAKSKNIRLNLCLRKRLLRLQKTIRLSWTKLYCQLWLNKCK